MIAYTNAQLVEYATEPNKTINLAKYRLYRKAHPYVEVNPKKDKKILTDRERQKAWVSGDI